jgi:hypothetical protein
METSYDGQEAQERAPARQQGEARGDIEEATVDAYNESEQTTGWFTIIEQNLALPFQTTVLGVTVTVVHVDLNASEQDPRVCKRGRDRQALPILDLPMPNPPPKGAEWIVAYRQWRGGGDPRLAWPARPGPLRASRRSPVAQNPSLNS